jgi:hypothetical protein
LSEMFLYFSLSDLMKISYGQSCLPMKPGIALLIPNFLAT